MNVGNHMEVNVLHIITGKFSLILEVTELNVLV